MMSPYEGERIFEAEMVRLHQCDRTLYACTPRLSSQSPKRRSFWQWFARGFTPQPARPPARPASPGRAPD